MLASFYPELHFVHQNYLGYDFVLIGFDTSNFILQDKWIGRFSLSVVIKRKNGNFVQVITCVYDPNRRALRPDFWQEILFLKHRWAF